MSGPGRRPVGVAEEADGGQLPAADDRDLAALGMRVLTFAAPYRPTALPPSISTRPIRSPSRIRSATAWPDSIRPKMVYS